LAFITGNGVESAVHCCDRSVVSLPAECPQAFLESDDVRFDWLQICHPHPRDRSIRFVAEGHKYFVDNKPFDLSVTGFVGTFSEDSVRVQGV
jgi:hypothetical protein